MRDYQKKGSPFKKKCLVTDDYTFLANQTHLLRDFDFYYLHDFEPNGQIAIFSATPDTLDIATAKFKRLAPQKKAHSIIACRESKFFDDYSARNLLQSLKETRIVTIPTCNDFVYAHWLRLLAGEPNIRVFPHYFFPTSDNPEFKPELEKWTRAFAQLTAELLLVLDSKAFNDLEWLEKQTGVFGTELWKSSKRLFDNPPGLIMRTCRVFLLLIECMRREQLYFEKYGKRRSALPDMPGDFRRALQRVFGMSYSELRKEISNPIFKPD
ncbi:MAG: hypothetical protein H6696_09085 [Deferribacteres bacterium]|nr:hypothetical protein [candidate division KSB1 bacterium]MCB9502079.1 hypothetical protein [Deferribacteres bacterium]